MLDINGHKCFPPCNPEHFGAVKYHLQSLARCTTRRPRYLCSHSTSPWVYPAARCQLHLANPLMQGGVYVNGRIYDSRNPCRVSYLGCSECNYCIQKGHRGNYCRFIFEVSSTATPIIGSCGKLVCSYPDPARDMANARCKYNRVVDWYPAGHW